MLLPTPTTLFLLLLTLLLSLTPLTTAWIIYIYDDAACQDDYFPTLSDTPNAWAVVGVSSICVQQGGNSWGVSENTGCKFSSWSGVNCEGESTPEYTAIGCREVPFASVKVDC